MGAVIVAGAGAAGLAATSVLVGRGHDVTVREARERIGGRVWTLRDARVRVPIELGAEFVQRGAAASHACPTSGTRSVAG